MKITRYIIVFVSVLLFVGCNKKDTDVASVTATKKIKRITTHYSDIPLVDTASFSYDNSGRLVTYRDAEIDTTRLSNYSYANYEFSYSGTNAQPDSYIVSDKLGNSYTHRLFYNSTTYVPIMDSVVASNSTVGNHETIKISINNNIVVYKDYMDPSQPTYYIDSIWMGIDSNILQRKMGPYSNGVYRLEEGYTYSYINSPNPLFNARIACLNRRLYGNFFGYKNLVSAESYTHYSVTAATTTYAYQYVMDTTGLSPKLITRTSSSSSGKATAILEYY